MTTMNSAMTNMKDVLWQLVMLSSPSGSEEQVTDLFLTAIAPYVDEVYKDANGNCIAHHKGAGRKLMLMAHADEVGLMVSFIDDRGFLYFNQIGGIDTNILPGLKVVLQGKQGSVSGIIGKKPIHHLQSDKESGKSLTPDDLWIDIAAKDKADALSKVQIGSVATYESAPQMLSETKVLSKALDDKIGLAILISLAQELYQSNSESDVYYVASVQEELGARGAQMVSEAIRPDIGIAIDVTHATDYPTMSPAKDGDIALDRGPVIPLGPNMSKGVNQLLIDIAEKGNIPYQVEAIAKPTGTDARMIQVAGTGIKTGLVSIPCRYMHTPCEMVSLKDAEHAVALLAAYCNIREQLTCITIKTV